MAISNINYAAPRAYVAPRAASSEPTGGAYYPPIQSASAPATGITTGKMISWAAGAFSMRALWDNFFRNPRGWGLVAVLGAGAYAGNWLYNKFTGRG